MNCIKTIKGKYGKKKKKEIIKLWFGYMHIFFSFYFSALPKGSTGSMPYLCNANIKIIIGQRKTLAS